MLPGEVITVHEHPAVVLWSREEPDYCIVPVTIPAYRELAVALVRKYHGEAKA